MTTWTEPGPVMPVIVLDDPGLAVDLAHALVAGGIRHLEVTLRTAAALESIRRIRDAVPQALVGAGTVLDAGQWQQACDAGARFGVSPGWSPGLAAAVVARGLPFLPGVATATEAMHALGDGFTLLKLFPAEAVGGARLLSSLYAPIPDLVFCPTGGIDAAKAPTYLALPNVLCVGGSWMLPKAALESGDYAKVEELARAASALNGRR